jgi:16S rRNA U1498 N3-methylase RsmE
MALDHWRRIAARARPQSERWYQAKFATALALSKLGQKREAADRIQYLQATTPALASTPWAQRFADLLRKCQ